MSELKELLVEELQDLLNAENQIVGALPKMVDAAHDPTLKETFEKHLIQTEGQVERLKKALEMLGENTDSKPCKAMKGILEEGEETIKDSQTFDELTADLALIGAAQKVEHYEISSYGTARCLARQIGERQVATLLSHTLGEEEAADFLLSEVGKPLLQQSSSAQFGNGTKTPWGELGDTGSNSGESKSRPVMGHSKAHSASASGSSAFKVKKSKA